MKQVPVLLINSVNNRLVSEIFKHKNKEGRKITNRRFGSANPPD